MNDRLVFLARREHWGTRIQLSIGARDSGDGRTVTHAAQGLTFLPIEPSSYLPDSISLTPDEAQALVDELWILGVRPSEGTGSAGSLAATERHLADMRRVAFASLRAKGIKADPS